MASQRDLTGMRFTRWVALEKVGEIQRKEYKEGIWRCRCDCGTVRDVRTRLLLHKRSGSRSCGCLQRDVAQKQFLENNPNRTHGLSHRHRLYPTWKTMRQRCMNPNSHKYHRYGARGIKVCERWDDFSMFLEDMEGTWKEGLTLDRINNDGNYEPGNCRWATMAEQARNKGEAKMFIIDSLGYQPEQLVRWEEFPDLANVMSELFNGNMTEAANLDFYEMHSLSHAIFIKAA